jgi:elongation factor P--beta-lysine ligase
VVDVSSMLRREHTVHGLHLNPQGKYKLMRLIAESTKADIFQLSWVFRILF